jgi:hypothetical protein
MCLYRWLIFYCISIPLWFLRPSHVSKAHFLASIRTKHEISRTVDGATRCPKHEPTYEEEEPEDQLTQQQFDDELQKDIAVMLTQEEFDEEAVEKNSEEGGAEV